MLSHIRLVAPFALVPLLAPLATAQRWFDAVTHYPAALERPLSNAFDFDGDGRDEYVGRKGTTWDVWKSSGLGDLAIVAQSAVPLASSTPGTPLIADFDGDLLADLAYVEIGPSPIPGGLRWQPGNAALVFGAGDAIALPLAPRRFAGGDSDGDGDADVAVLSAAGNQAVLGWYRRGPSGWVASELDVDPLSGAFSLTALELDHDGRADLALAQGNVLYLFTSAAAAPQFSTTAALPAQVASFLGPSLMSADFDQDGDDDVLAYVPGLGSSVIALVEQIAPGVLVAGPAQTVPIALGIARAADWDGDGDLDLGAGMQVVRNDGGVFETGAAFGIGGANTLGIGPCFSDLDSDGRLDLVGASSAFFGSGAFAHPVTPGPLTIHALLVDWEGDGDLDGLHLDLLTLRRYDGASYTLEPMNFGMLPPTAANHYYMDARAFADFDGDGARDLLAPLNEIVHPLLPKVFKGTKLLRGDGLGRFSDAGLAVPLPQSMGAPFAYHKGQLVLDAESDGDNDVLAQNGLWRNDGAGYFPSWDDFGTQGVHDGGDFDGDGDVDLLGWGATTIEIAVRSQLAPGSYATQTLAGGGWSTTVYLSVGDLDDDGDLDGVGVENGGLMRAFPLENVNGVLAPHAPTSGGYSGLVHAVDVDLDGKTDLATTPNNQVVAGRINVWRRTNGLSYEPARQWDGVGLLHGDVDQDGDVDFVAGMTTRNRAADPALAGKLAQYGSPTAGTSGVAPVLGYDGPMKIGTSVELRLRQVSGQGPSILGYSLGKAALGGVPFPSTTLAIDPVGMFPLLVIPLQSTGGASKGFTLTIPLDAGVAGLHVFKQAFVLDLGAPDLFSATNGLDVQYGL